MKELIVDAGCGPYVGDHVDGWVCTQRHIELDNTGQYVAYVILVKIEPERIED